MSGRSSAHRSRSRSRPRTGSVSDPREEGAGDYHHPRIPDTRVSPGPPTDATPPTRFAPPTPTPPSPCATYYADCDLSATGDGGSGIPLPPRTPFAAGQFASPAPSAPPPIAPPGRSMPTLWPGYNPSSDTDVVRRGLTNSWTNPDGAYRAVRRSTRRATYSCATETEVPALDSGGVPQLDHALPGPQRSARPRS